MAVVGKKRVKGITYYVTFMWNGEKVWERVGTDKRQAQSLNRRRQKEVDDGTYEAQIRTEAQTVGTFLEPWLTKRKGRWSKDETAYAKRYLLARPWLAGLRLLDARPKHALRLIEELDATISERTREVLSPKTVSMLHGIMHTMFRDAQLAELVPANPWKVPPEKLQRKARRTRKPYALQDIARVLSHPDVHPSARVFAAIAFFTGMREGEICGRRWRDWDPSPTPLGSLHCWSQYDDQPLKGDKRSTGEAARKIPVLPQLATVLTWWKAEGFELVHLRPPTEADFIVPSRRQLDSMSRGVAYDLFQGALTVSGTTNLTLHSTRHSFITQCRRGGAQEDVLEKVTHNASGSTVDDYTHWEWDPLCEAVLCFPLRAGDASAAAETNGSLNQVAPPRFELGTDDVTTRTDSISGDRGDPRDPPANRALPPHVDVEGAARHQRHQRVHNATADGIETAGFRTLPPGVQDVVAECLSRTIPLVHAGDVGALAHLERAAAAIDGAVT